MAEAAEKLPETVDAFLPWAERQPGRYELFEGRVVAMAAERALHALVKGEVFAALRDAVRARNLPCEAYPDGMTVRVNARSAFVPDALLRCGEPLPPDALEVPDPLVLVEVVSPSSSSLDSGRKLEGYFRVPSLRHYLIVVADQRTVVHHERLDGEEIRTRIVRQGTLRLDPPGIELALEALFPPEPRPDADVS